MDLNKINKELREETPESIVKWAFSQADKPIVTTNFRPYEAALIHVCVRVLPTIPVIWCDSGYNTDATYKHAETLISELSLNISLYVPRQSAAHRNIVMGGIPDIDSDLHSIFTDQVKLEPFKRAIEEHQPNLWFTNLRKGQTQFRDTLDIVSQSGDGIIKVSPFFHWTDRDLDSYLKDHSLPNENDYYDPTKVYGNRECGLHTQ
ncbi:MAG: phosphoadenylylsulfate reductase [Porticoccus sp.]|nr:phosphoadenylylsulfate reductase [Porticoccus sp.]